MSRPRCSLDVLCRIGGGDGFAAGLIYGLLAGRPPEEALRLGWAHGGLVTTFPGDVTHGEAGRSRGPRQGRHGAGAHARTRIRIFSSPQSLAPSPYPLRSIRNSLPPESQ